MNQLAIAQPENTQISIFNFEGRDVRTTAINGDPWFVAADICSALDIRNNRDALSRLDDDERGVATTDTPSGRQEMGVVNESGMYSLVLTSRKPEAKRFKKWVTSVLLPGIRKKEFVHVSQTQVSSNVLSQISASYESLRKDMEELKLAFRGVQPERAQIEAPVSPRRGDLTATEIRQLGLKTTAQIANQLGMTAFRLHAILEIIGMETRVSNRYFATNKAIGYFERTGTVVTKGGKTVEKFLWRESIVSKIPKKYL